MKPLPKNLRKQLKLLKTKTDNIMDTNQTLSEAEGEVTIDWNTIKKPQVKYDEFNVENYYVTYYLDDKTPDGSQRRHNFRTKYFTDFDKAIKFAKKKILGEIYYYDNGWENLMRIEVTGGMEQVLLGDDLFDDEKFNVWRKEQEIMKNEKRQTRKVGVAGGFINQMMGNNKSEPKVGEGATLLSYSDRAAYEVISVSDDRTKCVIREMDTKNIGQCYGDENYTYSSNEENQTLTLEWNEKKSCWGQVSYTVEVIKSLWKKLEYKYGAFNVWKNLPNGLTYNDLFEDPNADNYYNQMKLIDGITKKYKNFSKQSVIFGVMEEYRDPHF